LACRTFSGNDPRDVIDTDTDSDADPEKGSESIRENALGAFALHRTVLDVGRMVVEYVCVLAVAYLAGGRR
jgi:hypothetical protein